MGGGGRYYDRDTEDGYTKTSAGFSRAAEKAMDTSRVDPSMLPKGRRIISKARSPVVYTYDVTGSMGNLPMIIYDKMPLIAGTIAELGYLDDPEMAVGAIGDITMDSAPIQIGDFSTLKAMDEWLRRIWREAGGGGNDVEGYEHMAYYLAECCDMPNAVTPFCLFTGDEGIRPTLYKSDLERHFGGTHETISAKEAFKRLDRKFKNNVFLIHKLYGKEAMVMDQWKAVMPEERIILLGSDASIGDVSLGLFAVMSGARTLDAYLSDMKTARDKAQSDDRVAEVREALKNLPALVTRGRSMTGGSGKKGGSKREPSAPGKPGKKPGSGKRPGRI